jgi:hypothetical protein
MKFGTWFVNKTNAPICGLCTFGMEGKRYGIKKVVANANQCSCNLHANITWYLYHTNLVYLLAILMIL